MIATATFEKKLTEFYLTAGRNLIRALPRGRQISSPMFLAVREEYETAPRRLFIVGQETNSWYSLLDDLDSEPDALGPIQKLYEDFALGRSHKKSFFCQLMHEIQRKLEPYVPPMGFMWSNLFPCDE